MAGQDPAAKAKKAGVSETAAFLFITFAFCRSEKHLIFHFAPGKKKLCFP